MRTEKEPNPKGDFYHHFYQVLMVWQDLLDIAIPMECWLQLKVVTLITGNMEVTQ
jgi:hypothetical protein